MGTVAMAAAFAVADGVAVQDVDYGKLAARLFSDGQVFQEPPEGTP